MRKTEDYFLKKGRPLSVIFTASELNNKIIHNKINKNKIITVFKVLKQSINPTKDDFSVNFSSS